MRILGRVENCRCCPSIISDRPGYSQFSAGHAWSPELGWPPGSMWCLLTGTAALANSSPDDSPGRAAKARTQEAGDCEVGRWGLTDGTRHAGSGILDVCWSTSFRKMVDSTGEMLELDCGQRTKGLSRQSSRVLASCTNKLRVGGTTT